MKDPERIKRICKLLEEQWSKVPDQRLGQFLFNYVFDEGIDIFYQEDNSTEKRLQNENSLRF
jgi:uncharacterized protein YihD (DUF1040 family)